MRNIESDIVIAVSPEKAIRAFTDAALLKGWWGVEMSLIELKLGGIYTLAWAITGQGIKYVSTGIIKEYDYAGLLHIEKYIYLNAERSFLGPQELKIKAISSGTGCKLFLTQGPYPENIHADWDWFYETVTDAWPKVLVTLKTFLEEKFV
ncbi:MAG: SRPBCC domain-containing protein [Chitinophagaceae bacterium]|nr:SRPBCC domain-containing protein [Chitinophagaceae bacterium]